MKRSFLDLLILLAAIVAVEAWLSGKGSLIAAGLALPVVLEYKLEALIVFGIGVAIAAANWLAG